MHYHRHCHGQVLSNDETARPGEIKMIVRELSGGRLGNYNSLFGLCSDAACDNWRIMKKKEK